MGISDRVTVLDSAEDRRRRAFPSQPIRCDEAYLAAAPACLKIENLRISYGHIEV